MAGSAYHSISMLISAKQAPTEYMGGGPTHITDHDPESGEIGSARYTPRSGERPPQDTLDSWVAMFNSGVTISEITNRFGYPFLTVQSEIAKHPGKSRGVKSTDVITVYLTPDLAERVDLARGDDSPAKFVLRLLETGISDPSYSKAAAKAPTKAEMGRWRRMRGRGLTNSQIAQAVDRNPRDISKAIGPQRVVKEISGPRRKLSVRIPLWLKNMLDQAAETAGVNRANIVQSLVGKGLDFIGA